MQPAEPLLYAAVQVLVIEPSALPAHPADETDRFHIDGDSLPRAAGEGFRGGQRRRHSSFLGVFPPRMSRFAHSGLRNFNVMRSDSPIASICLRSSGSSRLVASVGGRRQTTSSSVG